SINVALAVRINIRLIQRYTIYYHGGIANGEGVAGKSNNPLDVILIWMRRCYKNYHITARRCMKKVGPLIYQNKFFIMEVGLHTHTFNIEILHGQANNQKHQDGKDYRLYYLPH